MLSGIFSKEDYAAIAAKREGRSLDRRGRRLYGTTYEPIHVREI
jgi:hypothetical protein